MNEDFWNLVYWQIVHRKVFPVSLGVSFHPSHGIFFSCGRNTQFKGQERKKKKKRKGGKEKITCQLHFPCMLDHYQEWKLPYVIFGSLQFFHERILLRPTAHFSVEVFFYFLIFVPQIKFLFIPFYSLKKREREKQLIIKTNQQMYHLPEIAIVTFGVCILDTMYTQTPLLLSSGK